MTLNNPTKGLAWHHDRRSREHLTRHERAFEPDRVQSSSTGRHKLRLRTAHRQTRLHPALSRDSAPCQEKNIAPDETSAVRITGPVRVHEPLERAPPRSLSVVGDSERRRRAKVQGVLEIKDTHRP